MTTSFQKSNKSAKKQKVFVALSGGVDSAVAAMLLVEQGYETIGIFMKNWSGVEFGIAEDCPWERDQDDAQAVCDKLGIQFKTYNFEKEYRVDVIQYFFDEYRAGRTPNPDIMCNQQIKFGRFLERAVEDNADMIATGHYAGRRQSSDGSFDLIRAKDENKDQTYFLYRLKQEQLAKSLFPLAELTKSEVRELAENAGLPVATKKDSQGICFIGKIDVQDFLQSEIKPRVGDIVDVDTSEKVGEHEGAWFYTNGQREGLRIGGAKEPYFVADKDVKKNIVHVAMGKENPRLYANTVSIEETNWINKAPPKTADLHGMARYRQIPEKCKLEEDRVVFDTPIWKPAPGQSAVLIEGDVVLGGGVISKVD